MASDEGNPQPSFEESLEALETIVNALEEGQVGLAESLEHYEQGVKLLKQCYGLLQKAERRIELLTGVDGSGMALTEPFEDAPTAPGHESTGSETTGSSTRSRRRTAKSSGKQPPAAADDGPGPIDAPRSLF